MKAYYDQRAPEYDDWYEGRGLFAARERAGWDEELAALRGVLRGLAAARTLDVACGTGFLTRELPGPVVAFDQSPRMLALARARDAAGAYVRGDAFSLPFPNDAFERLVTAHFYGHVQGDGRAAFLAEARRVARRLVVVDAGLRGGVDPEQWQERLLSDGTRWPCYKRFFAPDVLRDELGGGRVLHAGHWFVVVES